MQIGQGLKRKSITAGNYAEKKRNLQRAVLLQRRNVIQKDNADLKKLVQEMEDLRYEVKHGIKGKGDNVTLNAWFDVWLNNP